MHSGKYLFLGNRESGINFKDNWYPFRQDSTFLYYFGVNLPGLYAIIDVDNDEEIIFGDELTIKTYVSKSEGLYSIRHVEITNKTKAKLIVTSETKWCFMDAKTKKPARITSEIINLFH